MNFLHIIPVTQRPCSSVVADLEVLSSSLLEWEMHLTIHKVPVHTAFHYHLSSSCN